MTFPLAGNIRIKESVEALISSNRLPHAIIIEGEAGTGKHTLAKYLAKAAVCESDTPPCSLCRNCHLANAGTHPDIEWVAPEDKKKNIAVDQIRSLRDTAHRSAHTAKRRVFIIEQAETMNPSAQNSLLKVLEEPPSDVLFILITVSSKMLLDTVVSRCLVLPLFPPSLSEGIEVLQDTFNLPKDRAEALLIEENNNIGVALSRFTKNTNSIGKSIAYDFFEKIENSSPLSALLVTVPLEKNRPEATKFVSQLSEILINKIKQSRELVLTGKKYTQMLTALQDLAKTLDANINLSLFFTALTSKLMSIKNK